MSAFRRSNVLIEHVLGPQDPKAGDTWRLRKGERHVVVDEVWPNTIYAHEPKTGRRTVIRRDTLIARYVKVDPAEPKS